MGGVRGGGGGLGVQTCTCAESGAAVQQAQSPSDRCLPAAAPQFAAEPGCSAAGHPCQQHHCWPLLLQLHVPARQDQVVFVEIDGTTFEVNGTIC